jgi:hypothetical protein
VAVLLAFAVLEEFDLAEAFFGFLLGFVGAAEILLSILRNNFVTVSHFLDHGSPLSWLALLLIGCGGILTGTRPKGLTITGVNPRLAAFNASWRV